MADPARRSLLPRARAAVAFIFITALLDVISLGIMVPVLPNLVKAMAGGDTATAANYSLVFAATWGLMQLIFGPVTGMLSDRFGRRPVLLISIFGLGVDYLFMALAPSLGWLLVGRIINGVTSASFSTANAYIADIAEPKQRARAFGLMGGAFGIGFIIGPGIGGWLGHFGLRVPFFFAAGLALVNWLYGMFILPESLAPELRTPRLDWRKAAPAVGALNFFRSRPELTSLAGVNLLFQLAHNAFPSVFVLYVGFRFGWGPERAGWMLMGTGTVSILVQFLLVGRAVAALGERGALLVGLGSAALAFLVYGLASAPAPFLAGILLGALSGLIGPGLQGLMTRSVGPSEQGRLQGANSALTGISAVVGPALYLPLLAFTARTPSAPPGLCILLAAGLSLLALLLAVVRARQVRTGPLEAKPQAL